MPREVWLCALAWVLSVGCEKKAAREEGPPLAVASQPRTALAGTASKAVDSEGELRVVLLGTGTPIPDPHRAPPAAALVFGEHLYLVDAGPGVVRQVQAARRKGPSALDPLRLDRLFLTHLHSDHTLGVAEVMRAPAVIGRPRPLWVYGPEGTRDMVDHLREAYRVDLRIRFEAEGKRPGFEVRAQEISKAWRYRDAAVQVRAVPVKHGLFEHAVGYHFEAGGRRVVLSGDTAPSDAIVRACDGCDVLVHEVYCASGLEALDPGVQGYHRQFHTSTRELAELATRARPRLLVLTHLLSFGCRPLQMLAEVREGFDGEVVVGEDLGVY